MLSSAADGSELSEASPAVQPDVPTTETVKAGEAQAKPGSAAAATASEPVAPLPKLSPHEFRQFNLMADYMDQFHNHFRQTWTMLYRAATTSQRPAGLSIRAFLDAGLQFIAQLTMHHNIEEQLLFPKLAKRMPEFQKHISPSSSSSSKLQGEAELLAQHKQIHKGMDQLEAYLKAVKNREQELEYGVLKEKMDGFGGVLWKHLDQEVLTLGAENMRRYWTVEEIRRLPV